MDKIKKSIIKLLDISLTSLVFKKNNDTCRRLRVPATAIKIQVFVKKIDVFSIQSKCSIDVYSKDSLKDDFFLSMEYDIRAAVSELSEYEQLEKFAKFGAPYNAFVHARELAADITGKAFGKIVILPLINITDLGKQIQIQVDSTTKDEAIKENQELEVQPTHTTDSK